MDWSETFETVKKLAGKKLKSISGRSDVTLVSIDEDHVVVRSKDGIKERPIKELQGLVKKLGKGKPVHVDTAVHGSRSSRNQPETILANLANVEWLKKKNRKHIVWVGEDTHEIGTLKEKEKN
jgi:hypothetical protein